MPRRDATLTRSAPLFAALGDETRLAVVARLSGGGPMSITELTAGTEVSRQAITKHLNVLAEAGIVRDFWRGRERVWELRPEQFDDARRILDRISNRWDEALERLRNAVEDE